jgi:hypothetical protein
MALQILSDMTAWREAAYVDNGDGSYTLKDDAYAYVVVGSMIIGMDVLDESTSPEWLARLRAWETIDGPLCHTLDSELGEYVGVMATMDRLRPYFGTRTNAFPKESAVKFRARVGKALMERLHERVQRELDAVAETVH